MLHETNRSLLPPRDSDSDLKLRSLDDVFTPIQKRDLQRGLEQDLRARRANQAVNYRLGWG